MKLYFAVAGIAAISAVALIPAVQEKAAELIKKDNVEYNAVVQSQQPPVIAAPVSIQPIAVLPKASSPDVKKVMQDLPFTLNRDSMENISFYSPKGQNLYTDHLTAYISAPDGSPPLLRIQVAYAGSGWIFWQHAKVKINDDAVVFEKFYEYGDVTRDAQGSSVFEETDFVATEEDIAALEKIATSTSAVIRLSGAEKREDYKLSTKARANLKLVLETYKKLK